MRQQHRFSVGQVVSFLPGPLDRHVPCGKYTIQRVLPSDTTDLRYRVKHATDGHERVVSEAQLACEPRPAFAGGRATR